MNSVDEILNKISDIDTSRSTTLCSLNPIFTNSKTHISNIAQQVLEKKTPVVLWNIAPSDHFGILHAIYYEKIKQLADLGCKCVVLIYDAYERDICNSNQKNEQQIRDNAIRLSKTILSKNIKEEKIEFVLESDLRQGIELNEFLRKIFSLSEIFNVHATTSLTSSTSAPLYTIVEFFYEYLIDADIVVASEKDATDNWGVLRTCTNIASILPGYTPPLIISFPIITDVKGDPLSSRDCAGSISNIHSKDEIFSTLRSSNKDFLKYFFDYLYFPNLNNVSINGKRIRNFESLVAEEKKESIVNRAYKFSCEYFLGSQ
ncbi:MAG: hypothetical protein ACD_19C00405G0002 [uncultured bacterium]|nr:MAG: hypothetical protein ACD_19C00405G0002 [uncultured bacterium]